MSLPKKTKKKINLLENALENRYLSSRWVFVLATLLFFTTYLFAGANFYYDFFIKALPYSYGIFIVSFLFFIFFSIKRLLTGKIPEWSFYIIFVLLLVIFTASLTPFVIKLG